MKVLTRFVTSAAAPQQFPPPGAPEIAFLGRSNVGKSSLINALVGSKIAKTSNTPGRTQTINFFQVRRPGKPHPDFIFADLPGYGYARVPKDITERWAQFVNPYLEKRESLVLCLSLVDVTIPPQQLDLQLHDWLRNAGRKFLVVATKADRISNNQLRNSLNKFCDQLQCQSRSDCPVFRQVAVGPRRPVEGHPHRRRNRRSRGSGCQEDRLVELHRPFLVRPDLQGGPAENLFFTAWVSGSARNCARFFSISGTPGPGQSVPNNVLLRSPPGAENTSASLSAECH